MAADGGRFAAGSVGGSGSRHDARRGAGSVRPVVFARLGRPAAGKVWS